MFDAEMVRKKEPTRLSKQQAFLKQKFNSLFVADVYKLMIKKSIGIRKMVSILHSRHSLVMSNFMITVRVINPPH